jgi:hypothetical protein
VGARRNIPGGAAPPKQFLDERLTDAKEGREGTLRAERLIIGAENLLSQVKGVGCHTHKSKREFPYAQMITALSAAGFIVALESETAFYRYHPSSDELRQMIDQVAETYAKNLVEVTNIIHSKTGKRAQQFADAFKWRKDS